MDLDDASTVYTSLKKELAKLPQLYLVASISTVTRSICMMVVLFIAPNKWLFTEIYKDTK
jgi:hypothetical protein